MNNTVTIGEFARLTHLSVKALRHYHDVGVLTPAEIDNTNGYRRYALDQLPDAHLVRRLRELDMPLDGVRAALTASGTAERDAILAHHLDHLERELASTRAAVSSLRSLLGETANVYDVAVRHLDPTPAYTSTGFVEAASIEDWLPDAFARLGARIDDRGDRSSGVSGALYPAHFFEDGCAEVTVFIAFEPSHGAERQPHVDLDVIDGGPYAGAVHCGPYGDLDRAYGAVGSYVAEHFGPAEGPIREHYLVGPDSVRDAASFRTEVLWPLA